MPTVIPALVFAPMQECVAIKASNYSGACDDIYYKWHATQD
jgi:hypothetical protein